MLTALKNRINPPNNPNDPVIRNKRGRRVPLSQWPMPAPTFDLGNFTTHRLHNDTVEYRVDGVLHRVDGPARTRPDGSEEWWLLGRLHRLDGPAVTTPNGHQVWAMNGKLHRLDGPAITYPDGRTESWVNGARRSGVEEVVNSLV